MPLCTHTHEWTVVGQNKSGTRVRNHHQRRVEHFILRRQEAGNLPVRMARNVLRGRLSGSGREDRQSRRYGSGDILVRESMPSSGRCLNRNLDSHRIKFNPVGDTPSSQWFAKLRHHGAVCQYKRFTRIIRFGNDDSLIGKASRATVERDGTCLRKMDCSHQVGENLAPSRCFCLSSLPPQ